MCVIVCTLCAWCGDSVCVRCGSGVCSGVGLVVGLLVGVMGSRHRFVAGSRSPVSTRRLLYQMKQDVSVKVAVHPWSQRVLMEMRDEWASPGTMCARVAAAGSPGMSK